MKRYAFWDKVGISFYARFQLKLKLKSKYAIIVMSAKTLNLRSIRIRSKFKPLQI